MELIEEVDIVWFCEKQNKALLKQTKARHGDTHLQSQHQEVDPGASLVRQSSQISGFQVQRETLSQEIRLRVC